MAKPKQARKSKVTPPTPFGNGMLLYSSAAHREAYIEQEARARCMKMLPDYIRSKYPEFTPERVASLLAIIVINEARR